jgi:hypothetical protein
MDENLVAERKAVGAQPQLHDGAGHLVAQGERQRVRQRPGRPMHEVQIGVAQPRTADLHDGAARRCRRRGDLA